MKLITKINLNFISSAIFILFAGCVGFYLLLRSITLHNTDRELMRYRHISLHEFEQLLRAPEQFVYFDVLLHIHQHPQRTAWAFDDTTLLIKQQPNHFRRLRFGHQYRGQWYQVEIYKSLRQADELIVSLLFALCAVIVFFLVGFYFLNRFVAMKSLDDFFQIIARIRHIRADATDQLLLPPTDVDEFEQLNQVLIQMAERIRHDYINLKEFTENASHEIQTPLAIVATKVDQLLQDPNLTEAQLVLLAGIQEALNRLSKLNKGLILLAKIENHQFADQQPVDLSKIVSQQLENLADYIDDKQLHVHTHFVPQARLPMLNPYLAELLVFNLIKNAVQHTPPQGSLRIDMTDQQWQVRNTAQEGALELGRIFERFQKGKHLKSLGLGLAIVKKICDQQHIGLQYDYTEGQHRFSLRFGGHVGASIP